MRWSLSAYDYRGLRGIVSHLKIASSHNPDGWGFDKFDVVSHLKIATSHNN
jgi:hypothetical protein